MKLTADYHVHTSYSADSDSPMEDMVKHAIDLKLTHICFTDHMDYDFPKQFLENDRPFEFDVEDYFKKVSSLQDKYQGQIKILAGIELGVKPELANRLNQLVTDFPFDFVIASSHLLNNYDPYYPDYWNSIHNNSDLGIRQYFESIRENVEAFTNFDVYGHLDYIVRYAPDKNFKYDPAHYQEEIDTLLKLLVRNKKGIEINTAGLKYGLPFAHPKEEILARFLEFGGSTITVGSDAHKPEHLAYAFEDVGNRLVQLQVPHISIFENRQAISL